MCAKVLKELACDLTVLYVEDDSQTRELFKGFLSKFFKEITEAVNGQEALELYKNASFDLVLTDIDMPILDGRDLVKEIQKLDEDQAVAVCSASHGDSGLMVELLNHGVGGFVTKPVEYEEACDILKRVCRRIRRRQIPMSDCGGYEAVGRDRVSDLPDDSFVCDEDWDKAYPGYLHDDDRKELNRRLVEMETTYVMALGTSGFNAQYSVSKLGLVFVQYGSVLRRYHIFNEMGMVILELGQMIIEECNMIAGTSDKMLPYIDRFCSLLRDFTVELDKKKAGNSKSFKGAIIAEASNIMTQIVLF